MAIEIIAHSATIDKIVEVLREAGLTLVGDEQVADPEHLVLITPAALWDATTTDQLLSTSACHGRLIATEPYRTWLARRGGVAAVLAWVEEVALPRLPDQLAAILRGVLDGEHYNVTAQRVFLSRARFYNARQRMFVLLSDALNSYRV